MFKFSSVDIPLGAILHHAEDKNITATVVSDTQIDFAGIRTSLSGAALLVLQNKGVTRTSIQGPKMWTWNGNVLSQIVTEFKTKTIS